MAEHEKWIRRCFELADAAVEHGNHPFGALLVMDDKAVVEIENTVVTQQDITRHAELSLVSVASREFTPEQLARITLYTSTEPCVMCSGAIYWSGIRKVVYGCSAETLARIAGESFVKPTAELFAGVDIELIGPVLEETGAEQHQAFWLAQ